MKFCGKTVNVKETVLYTISSLLATVLDYVVYLTVLYLLHGEDHSVAVAPFGKTPL